MPERPLPELTPEMLLSYGGMRELEGARAIQSAERARVLVNAPGQAGGIYEITGVNANELSLDEPTAEEEFGISFDQDFSEFEGQVERPSSAERFNVLRPPAHEPFRPPPPMPGPQGGNMREVGRVGRFSILAEQESRPDPALRFSEALQRIRGQRDSAQQEAREMNEKTREQVIAHRAAIHEKLPTAYDRLMGEDQYEDDLE
jgi:hypothetical protein